MRGYLLRLYEHLPPWLADRLRVAYGYMPASLRFGREYHKALELARESDGWDGETIRQFQERRLRRLIDHCYANVPYYRRIMDEHGLRPHDITTAEDLKKLPLLTKELVRAHRRDLRAGNVPGRKTESIYTSGTTGAPLRFLIDNETRAVERAMVMRHLHWLGYRTEDLIADMKSLPFPERKSVYRYSPVTKVLRFSTGKLDHEKMQRIFEAFEKFRPAYVRAYPSALYVISRWMVKHRKSLGLVRYIITSSEVLYPFIKETAELAFNCPVIDHYGQMEQVTNAFQCAEAKGYHIQMEHSVTELIPVAGGRREVVGTCLTNLAMPFIRYRTSDLAGMSEEPCPCGRKHPLLSHIEGRHGDIIITPEGALISVTGLTEAFEHCEEIREAQFVQEEVNRLIIKLVPWQTLTQQTSEAVVDGIRRFINSPKMNYVVEAVTEIPATPRGKKPFVVSHLRPEEHM